MPATSGRNARLYATILSGGTAAEPIAYLREWSLDQEVDRYDVTSFGDANRKEVAGLPAASGTWAGYFDTATVQFYNAARDGVERKFYAYIDTTLANAKPYFFGTATFSNSITTPVDGAATINGTFSLTSDLGFAQ